MRKSISILIIIVILIITGCSNKEVIKHNYTYKGENEFWTAEYKVNGAGTFTEKDNKTSYESKCSKEFIVTYKKDLSELSSVKHLEISYKSSVGGGKTTQDFDDSPPNEKTYILKKGGTATGGAIENKDEVIEVTINLDGKIQTLELRNVQ